MNKTTRRKFIKSAAAVAGGICTAALSGGVIFAARSPKREVRIEHISYRFEEHVFRTPLKFALTVVDRATLLTVTCTVRTAAGKIAEGFGTLPLNYTFSFPSKKLSADTRLGAMKTLAGRSRRLPKNTRNMLTRSTSTGHWRRFIAKLPPKCPGVCSSPIPFPSSAPWSLRALSMPPSTMPLGRPTV